MKTSYNYNILILQPGDYKYPINYFKGYAPEYVFIPESECNLYKDLSEYFKKYLCLKQILTYNENNL